MEQSLFATWDISDWEVVIDETAGQEEKLWLAEPGTGVLWLYKPPTVKNGFRQGEDWAEKVSQELAALVGVPCAEVRLASRYDKPGSISRNLVPTGWEMQAGGLLLAETDESYQHGTCRVKGRPGHSIARIFEVLQGVGPPPNAELPGGFGAFDVFTGYLMLDAWVANRDRHDENWSVLLPLPTMDQPRRLCASYDQAGSLGYNMSAARCLDRLTRPNGVTQWAHKGSAHRFEHDPAVGPNHWWSSQCRHLSCAARLPGNIGWISCVL